MRNHGMDDIMPVCRATALSILREESVASGVAPDLFIDGFNASI